MNLARVFFRCVDCLTVTAAATHLPIATAECGVCRGRLESMGPVRRDRLAHEFSSSPCDDRCTSARGPICNCPCGGRNHGAGILATFRVTGTGALVLESQDPGEALLRALEWRGLLRQFEDFLTRSPQTNGEWARQHLTKLAVAKAKRLRSHAARVKLLQEYL